MKAYYCDHFVLPLPQDHRFPMAKYRLLRERVMTEGIIDSADLREAMPASWADLALVHTPEYLTNVEHGTLPREIQRRIGFPWSEALVKRSGVL